MGVQRAASRGWGALAGLVGAGVALAVTEVVSALDSRRRPSVIGVVASRSVDWLSRTPLKDWAISVFGTHDKGALLTGIVVVAIAAGAALGALASQWPIAAPVGLAGFAIVGVVAGARDPQASTGAVAVASILGAVAGAAVIWWLLRTPPGSTAEATSTAGAPPTVEATPTASPPPPANDRRNFLTLAGGAGALAIVGTAAGRIWRATAPRLARLGLPAPVRSLAPPASQPFAVDGLTPFLTTNAKHYRIDTAIFVPQIDASSWRLRVDGRVDHPFEIGYEELLGMELVEEPITLACVSNDVGGHLISTSVWRGVPLATLLDRAGVHADATQVVGRSVDDFTVGFPTATGLDGRTTMVAVGMNGVPLPDTHGFPARLIVAGLYGYVSATKWLRQIELTRWEDFDAYWVERDWSKLGPIKTESRVDVPASGVTIPAGPFTLAGVAWAPTRGISKVEVQVDRQPFAEARLGRVTSTNTWVQWTFDATFAPGEHVVAVRATDGHGDVQTDVPRIPAPDGASGYHYRGFTVA